MRSFDKFYCESEPKRIGLPEGFDEARIDWDERLKMADMGMDSIDLIQEDRVKLMREGYHVAVAGGFVGTWPTDPEVLSGPDEMGGVRIGFRGSSDPYFCSICLNPIRMTIDG